jgi:hypothetical protein
MDCAAKPASLFTIALMAIGLGGVLGAFTNAMNGAISPRYFRTILGWHAVEDVWRAAVAQGIFEGLLYGAAFAIAFTLVVGVVSRGRVSVRFATRHLVLGGAVTLAGWCLGGVLAIGLAMLSPDFYRATFIGVPQQTTEMAKYAWVGGSIWGALFGGLLGTVIASITVAVDWRRHNPLAPIGSSA